MSVYAETQDWLSLKHRTMTKPCMYGLSGGENEWDFAGTPSRSYLFASEETPIHLLNNSGGMDDDDTPVKDVWYPHEAVRETEDADSEMSDDRSSRDDMDMDISMDTSATTTNSNQATEPQQFQHQIDNTLNKRKRGSDALELNTNVNSFGFQQSTVTFDSSKRVRVGA